MNSFCKFILFLAILFHASNTFAIELEVVLNCKFSSQRIYFCLAKGLENQDKNSVFSNVIGSHSKNMANEQVEGLLIKGQNVSFIPKNISKFFKKLERYEVKSSWLTSIERDDFKGLSDLDSLILDDNLLVELSPDVFNDLIGLKNLRLDGNKFTEFHYKTFSKIINLEVLRLENNQLTSIHEDLFAQLHKLKEIYLQNNKIHDLREQTFAKCSQLEVIDLSNNLLKTVGPEALKGLQKLKTHNFNNNECITKNYTTVEDLKEIFQTSCFPPYFTRFVKEIEAIKKSETSSKEKLSSCEKSLGKDKEALNSVTNDLKTANEEKSSCEENHEACKTEKNSIQETLDACNKERKLKDEQLLEVNANLTKCESIEKDFIKSLELTNKTVANAMKDVRECKLKTDLLSTALSLAHSRYDDLEKELQNKSKINPKIQPTFETTSLKPNINNNDSLEKKNVIEKNQELEKLQEKLNESEKISAKLMEENKKFSEKMKQAEQEVTSLTKSLKKCMTQMTPCNNFFIGCSYQVVPRSEEYVCRAKHVSACQPGMKLNLEGTHRFGKSNSNVNVLEIQDSIFHFTNDIFKHLPYLSKIQVKNGGLSTLEPRLESSSLRELEIELNSFRDIPNEIFSGVRNLHSLLLDKNAIEILYKDSFAGINHLKQLSLKDNRISELPQSVFDELTSLTHLSMVNNRLTVLNGNLLKFNTLLQVVKFDDNNDLKLIGTTLLDFSTSLRMIHFNGTCIGTRYYDNIREVKESIRLNCQK